MAQRVDLSAQASATQRSARSFLGTLAVLPPPARLEPSPFRLQLNSVASTPRDCSGFRPPRRLAKSGLVAYLFLSGKDKEAIAAELKAAFKLPDAQAAKIVRRITGRARFFQRVDELMAAK